MNLCLCNSECSKKKKKNASLKGESGQCFGGAVFFPQEEQQHKT